MVLNTEWAQVEVIDLINDGSGLAFGIIGGRSTGVVVKTILPGGVADRDGRLQSGDHILQIGEVNLRGLGSEQVASVLRQCGVHVRMVVARPIECANSDYQNLGSQAPIVPTKILGDPVELDRHLIENGYAEAFAHPPSNYTSPYIYTGQHTDIQLHGISGMVEMARDPRANVPYVPAEVHNSFPKMLPMDLTLHESDLPETETYVVELKKDDLGLGITVAGYVCEKEEISGIFVKSISIGSAADLTNNIKINDRIVEVDGISVIGFTNHQAVELLRNTGPLVTIKVERYLRGPKYEQLQQAIRANELRPPSPSSPTISSLPKVPLSLVQMDYLNIEPDGESRTSFEFDSAILLETSSPINEEKEIVIGGEKRSVQFSIASHESIYDKWREKLDKDVEIVIAQMHKESTSGLGISLEGTVDVEDGKEVRPHHYIRNILPDGPVGRNGILQSGDELLEVNGIQLLGLNHLEVVSILKQLPNFVSIVCARYPVPIRVIDTSQHREAFQARKILAGSLQTLIPTSESSRLVKAKSETSIASSLASEATASRSRSLELIAGLPMWSDEPTVVELNKGDHGLGFSILDYQDPLNPQETVIVIRSLVPGGVTQTDGRLIPGDRLLGVNDINVEHATLDMAVQVLKGAPKGIVRITVAKPLNSNDAVSHASQDTEEDQTCLEDFQECIEEYQECLDVVHICIDEENSFNHSPCTSQVEDFGQKVKHAQINLTNVDFLENNYLNVSKSKGDVGDSDIDISFKSTNDNYIENLNNISVCNNVVFSKVNTVNNNQNERLVKADSLTQSDKPSVTQSSVSEKDGYETCVDDSLSEDNVRTIKSKQKQISFETELKHGSDNLKVQNSNIKIEHKLEFNDNEDLTPTNSKVDILDQFFVDVSEANLKTACTSVAVSEPCLNVEFFPNRRHLYLDTKLDGGLKSYDNQSEDLGGDEFFLVQYPTDVHKEVCKSMSEPNVLETYEIPTKTTYRRCLKEYYNDYADCIEAYRLHQDSFSKHGVQQEMADDDIFNEILLPFKSRSAPDIMDRSFVMLTYDPGPDIGRRKSAFVPGYQCSESSPYEMTVIRPIDTDYGTLKGCHVDEMLQKHWGSTHTVKIFREPNKSLGISIVGGKVDLHSSEKSSDTLLGIFVKNVVPNSPAGKTGQFKTGDRILEVSGIDLRQASHETAVQAIRNASNPVTFVVQSLIPWKSTDAENNSVNNESNCPSPFPSPVSVAAPVDIKNIEFTAPEKIKQIKTATEQSKVEELKNLRVTPEKSNQKSATTIEPSNSAKTISMPKCQSPATAESLSPSNQPFQLELKNEEIVPRISPLKSEKEPIQSPECLLKTKLESELDKEERVTPQSVAEVPLVAEAQPSSSEGVSEDKNIEPEKVIPPREESLEPSEDEEDEDIREMEGRTVSAGGQQIDRASAANVKRSKDEIQADPEEEDEFGYTMSE
ncbi:uncharacterized protein LOC108904661 [Anoplophora glabripennis]|nr:uncharacterized protein LOC108904661 [Anoplophora glabripennis]